MTLQSAPYAALADRWRRAEVMGFDSIWIADHSSAQYPGLVSYEAWSLLGALATVTTRVRFAALVTPPTFRHPAMLATRRSRRPVPSSRSSKRRAARPAAIPPPCGAHSSRTASSCSSQSMCSRATSVAMPSLASTNASSTGQPIRARSHRARTSSGRWSALRQTSCRASGPAEPRSRPTWGAAPATSALLPSSRSPARVRAPAATPVASRPCRHP